MFWKYDAGPDDITIWWHTYLVLIYTYLDSVDCEGNCQRAKIPDASIDLFSLIIVMDYDIIS